MFGGKEGFQKELDTYVSKRGNLKNQINELTKYAQASAEASAEISKLTTLQNNLAKNQDIDESKRLKVGIEGITQALKELQKTSNLTPEGSNILGNLENEIAELGNIDSLGDLENKIKDIINKIKTFRSSLAPQAAGIQNELENAIQAGGGDSSYVQELYNQIYNAVLRQAMYPVETGKDTPIEKPSIKVSPSEAIAASTGALMEFYGTIQATQGVWETFTDDSANWAEKFGAALGTLTSAFMTFNGIMEAGQAITAAISGIHTKNALAKTADAVATKGLTQATDKHTASVVANNAALMANPIIAIIAVALTSLSLILGAVTAAQEAHTEALRESAEASKEALDTETKELENKIKLTQTLRDSLQIYEENIDSKESLKEAAEQVAEAYDLENEALMMLQENYEGVLKAAEDFNEEQLKRAIMLASANLENQIALTEEEHPISDFTHIITVPNSESLEEEIITVQEEPSNILDGSSLSISPDEILSIFGDSENQSEYFGLEDTFKGRILDNWMASSPILDSNLSTEYYTLEDENKTFSSIQSNPLEGVPIGYEGILPSYSESHELYQGASYTLSQLDSVGSAEQAIFERYENLDEYTADSLDSAWGTLERFYARVEDVNTHYALGLQPDEVDEFVNYFYGENRDIISSSFFPIIKKAYSDSLLVEEENRPSEFINILMNELRTSESSPLMGLDLSDSEIKDIINRMIPNTYNIMSSQSETPHSLNETLFNGEATLTGLESANQIKLMLAAMDTYYSDLVIPYQEVDIDSNKQRQESILDEVYSTLSNAGVNSEILDNWRQDPDVLLSNYEKYLNQDIPFYIEYIFSQQSSIEEFLSNLTDSQRSFIEDAWSIVNEDIPIEEMTFATLADTLEVLESIDPESTKAILENIEMSTEAKNKIYESLEQESQYFSEGSKVRQIFDRPEVIDYDTMLEAFEDEELQFEDYIDRWGRFRLEVYKAINKTSLETTSLDELHRAYDKFAKNPEGININTENFSWLTSSSGLLDKTKESLNYFLSIMGMFFEVDEILELINDGTIRWNEDRARLEYYQSEGNNKNPIYTSDDQFKNVVSGDYEFSFGSDYEKENSEQIEDAIKVFRNLLSEEGNMITLGTGERTFSLDFGENPSVLTYVKAYEQLEDLKLDLGNDAPQLIIDAIDEAMADLEPYYLLKDSIDPLIDYTAQLIALYSGKSYNLGTEKEDRYDYYAQREKAIDDIHMAGLELDSAYTREDAEKDYIETVNTYGSTAHREQEQQVMGRQQALELMSGDETLNRDFLYRLEDEIFVGLRITEGDSQEDLKYQIKALQAQADANAIQVKIQSILEIPTEDIDLSNYEEVMEFFKEYGPELTELGYSPEEYLMMPEEEREDIIGETLYGTDGQGGFYAQKQEANAIALESLTGSRTGEAIGASSAGEEIYEGEIGRLQRDLTTLKRTPADELSDSETQQIAELEERIAELKNRAEELQSENAAIDFAQDNYANEAFKQEVTDLGLDYDEVDALGDSIQLMAEDMSEAELEALGLSKALADNEELADDLAKKLQRYNRAVEEVTENIEEWKEALDSDDWEERAEAIEEVKDSVEDMLDLSPDALKDVAINADEAAEMLELMEKAAKGDTEAYDQLQATVAENIMIGQGAQVDPSLRSALDTISTEVDNLPIGLEQPFEVGEGSSVSQDLYDSIEAILLATAALGGDVAANMRLVAEALGLDMEVETKTFDVDVKSPNYDPKAPIWDEGTQTWYTPIEPSLNEEKGTVTGVAIKTITNDGSNFGGSVGTRSGRGRGGGGGGGGGGSRAPRAERKTDKDKDRYRTVKNQLEDLTDSYDKVSTAADRAFGETKLELLKQQEKAIQDLISKQREYIDEINEYYDIDRKAVEEVSSRLGFAVEFDANGTITNWDEIQDKMIEEYNSHINDKGEVIGMDEEAWSEYEKEWERIMELFNQYDETQDLRKEALQQLQDYANQLYDLQLQEVTYVVEIKIDATDDALEILDYMLGRIEDDAWAAAEAIAYMGQKAAEIQLQNNTYTEGIRGILMNHTRDLVDSEGNIVNSASLTVEDVEGFMSGQEAAIKKIMALNEEFTDEEVQQLREYNSSLIEMNETLNDLRNEVFDKVLDSFEAFNDEMDRSIDKIDHLSSLTENYANIIDIVGQKNLEISNALMESISQATVDQATNRVEATREKMLTIQDEITRAEEALADAKSKGLEEDVKLWEDTLKEMNDSLDEAEEEFLQSWEDALTAAAEAFEASMNRAISTFSDALAGPLLGSLEQLEEMFDRQNTIADRYLPDYEKIYELNKLNRDITNSIDDTDNIRAKQELAALQEEINKLEEDGVQVSEYQVENLRRRYELKLAELALTESQNAKSEVRMSRNADGDWSYVYVADEEQVAEAEQNYEDKLFAMQQANAEYINNLNDMIIQMETELTAKLEEIANDETLSQEEKMARMNETIAFYQEQMGYYMDELGLVLGENQILYEQDWAKYSELTGYKISANEAYVDHFNETALSLLTGYETMEEFQRAFNDAIGHPDSGGLLYDLDNAFKTWEANMEEVFESAGTTMDDFSGVVEDSVNDIVENSDEAAESIKEMGDTVVSTFDEITSAVQNWSNVYSETIDSILARNEMLAKSFNELLKAWAGFEEATEVEEGTAPGEDEEVDTGDLEGGDGQTEEDKGKIQDGDAVYIAEGTPGIADWAEGPGRRYYAFYRNNAGRRAVGSGVWYVTVDPKNKKWDGYIGRIHEKYLRKFDTGGYTGAWGAEGRVAMLHEKELVLNKQDTSNLLAAVGMIRDISKIIDLNAYASSYGNITSTPNVVDNTGTLEQQVNITAEFPNVTDKDEILSAFDDIINLASQYANRR